MAYSFLTPGMYSLRKSATTLGAAFAGAAGFDLSDTQGFYPTVTNYMPVPFWL